ncbi:TRAP transporter large permease subunit, partial [Azospirillum sp.]|uniref:TRAP transporter large permease subunit n=1 Tax=Azospirillum sp. TaxID=34012 RepID=UPI002D47363F
SFMHPPFGFALFYLRSVAPRTDYVDKVTGKLTDKITTGQIYWGAVPFVIIQIIMVGIVIMFPGLVEVGLDRGAKIDPSTIQIEIPTMDYNAPPPFPGTEQPGENDPNADIMKQLQKQ